MKLTRSVSYAVGILLKVHAESAGQAMTAARISKGSKFPPRFLYRVLRRLVDAGVLRGVSGPGGGYRLARPASQISLWDIVEAVEGPQQPSSLDVVNGRHRQAIQQINALARHQHAATVRAFKKLSLARLAKRS